MARCEEVTSPETGETYRVQVDSRKRLTRKEKVELALYMDHVTKAAKAKMAEDLKGSRTP